MNCVNPLQTRCYIHQIAYVILNFSKCQGCRAMPVGQRPPSFWQISQPYYNRGLQTGLSWIESKVRFPTFKCSRSVFCLALFSTTVCWEDSGSKISFLHTMISLDFECFFEFFYCYWHNKQKSQVYFPCFYPNQRSEVIFSNFEFANLPKI